MPRHTICPCITPFPDTTTHRLDVDYLERQLAVDFQPFEGKLDSGILATFEVADSPAGDPDCEVLHVDFDSDNLAMSIFRTGESFTLRLEQGVRLVPNGDGTFCIESGEVLTNAIQSSPDLHQQIINNAATRFNQQLNETGVATMANQAGGWVQQTQDKHFQPEFTIQPSFMEVVQVQHADEFRDQYLVNSAEALCRDGCTPDQIEWVRKTHTPLLTPYDRGRRDFFIGASLVQNPYEAGSISDNRPRSAWILGWEYEYEALRQRMKGIQNDQQTGSV